MRPTFCVCLLSAGLLAGCAGVPSRTDAPRVEEPLLLKDRTVVLKVHGLSCPLCSNNLNGQLRRVAGVEQASIDLQTGAVTVRLAEGHAVTRADLARAVEQAGFTLQEVAPAGPAAP